MINFSAMRFLVVDDFSEFRSSIRGILGLLAVQNIDTAANGEDVLELCRRNRYDVILHDYNLGDGISGQQVLERLHAENLLSPHCIFIMVTAENTQAMVLAAIECEPDDYLSKPFSKVALQTRLERLVRRKQVLAPVLSALERGDGQQVLQACRAVEAQDSRHAVLCQRYKAEALRQLGQYAELEQLLEQQVRSRPANWNLQMLARLWLEQDRPERLAPLLNAAIRQFPLLPELHDIRAGQAAGANDLTGMVQSLQHAVSLSPNTVRRQIMLARHAWLADQPEVAAHAVRQCWEVGRYSIAFAAELLWQLASILLAGNRGRTADELQHWLRILEQRDMQTAALQPATALLRLVQQQVRGQPVAAGALQALAGQLCERLQNYAAVTLLQLGDWLQQLGAAPAALQCWQQCARRHAAVTGVPEQLARRLSGYDAGSMRQHVQLVRQAVALHLNGELESAADLFARLLQQTPELIALNMAAARLYALQAAGGDGTAQAALQACLQRIGQLSPLDPEAREYSRMSNPLETHPW